MEMKFPCRSNFASSRPRVRVIVLQHGRISKTKRGIRSFRYGWFVYNKYFSQLFSDTHIRSADRLGEDLLDRNKYVGQVLFIEANVYEKFSIDEILGKYGKEMTWDIRAGCMGKCKL